MNVVVGSGGRGLKRRCTHRDLEVGDIFIIIFSNISYVELKAHIAAEAVCGLVH
jgi:hypothetical protein